MNEEKPGPSRGRGALIAAALKKAQEARAQEQTEQAPRPRGRAALLEQLKKKNIPKIGAELQSPPTETQKTKVDLPQQFSELEIDKTEKTPLEYKGTSGTTVPASANYILLKQLPNRGVFEFEVRFEPTVDSKSAKVKMLNKTIDFCKAKTFDGTVLYLPEKIIDTQKQFHCEHPFSNEPITMTIIFKKQKKMDDCLHLYNVLFKKIMYILKYKRVGRQFFDNRNPFMVPQHKLEIWPGYVVSVNEYSGGIMLCLDITHRMLRTQTTLEYMTEILHMNGSRFKPICEKNLIGNVVLTRYNNRTYIIHDIVWDVTPKSKFETSDGNHVSFMDYYKRQYDLSIQDTEQPMLVNRQSVRVAGQDQKDDRIIMLIPELCYLTGLTAEMRSDFRAMKDIAQFTRITPNQRMNSLRKYIDSVNNTPEARDILKDWGLSIASATIDLQMRILGPEEILFGNDVTVYGSDQADWTSAAMKNRVLVYVDFRNWLIICTGQDKRQSEEFGQNLQRLGPKMGININKPNYICLPDDRNETYIKTLQEQINPSLQIVCIICPTNRDDRYMTIKKICCAKMPIPSQVINSRTLRNPKKLNAVTQKIALQMNCKMGGSLWSLRFPFKKWMIIGIDVYHSKSITIKATTGFVSSLNESMTKWYSRCCFHDNDKEIGDHLKILFSKALEEFYACNACYPTQIVVFRDGIGDGQLNTCLNFEIPQFLSMIQDRQVPMKLTYLVVQKRINTRIFTSGRMEDNPPAGSIVDGVITRKYLYDFFLIAQHVRQGTVTPTHYIVLFDNANIKPDYVQRLTYKMCHMYYNWTGTIRVPAPCQYAHKLAYLIGQNVRTEHSAKLAHSLFYL